MIDLVETMSGWLLAATLAGIAFGSTPDWMLLAVMPASLLAGHWLYSGIESMNTTWKHVATGGWMAVAIICIVISV